MRRLILRLTRDSINTVKNYSYVRCESSGADDIWILSGCPTELMEYETPVKVAWIINDFLRQIDVQQYDVIVKSDIDSPLNEDFLNNLHSDKVYGCGALMSIPVFFYKNYLKGKYPLNYCDDGYVVALADTYGFLDYVDMKIGYSKNKRRRYYYGIEFYKWGVPFFWIFFWMRRDLSEIKPHFFELCGWFYAFFNRAKKYTFAKYYSLVLIKRLKRPFKMH